MALTNGAKLFYKTTGQTPAWENIAGLKEIPDFGVEAEKVENTCLTDLMKLYEQGIGDAPELTYKFKYDGMAATDTYGKMKALQAAGNPVWFADAINGTDVSTETTTTDVYYFQAYVSVKRTGGAINEAIDFDMTLTPCTAFTTTKPA